MSNTPPMKKIVIAGANSFVASHFVHELLVQGFDVIALVRGSSDQSAQDRMNQALIDTTLNFPSNLDQLTVLDYALLEEDFGIPGSKLEWIFSEGVDFFHFAASLKFDYQSKEEIFKTNVDGLHNALKIFNRYSRNNDRLFFISTAYSCGIFPGRFEEKFYPEDDISSFRNYYEQSKRYAENTLKKFMEENGTQAHVIRLSQVVGNSETGVTITDYGIFDFARRIQALSYEFPHQTIRILADPQANQNLIAIDTTVHDLMQLLRVESLPTILNFVANKPVENHQIIQTISDLLPINLVPIKDITADQMNKLEQLVLSGMSFTGNYIDTDIRFDTTNRDHVISSNNRTVSKESLEAMLSYYLDQLHSKYAGKEKADKRDVPL